MSSNSNVSSSNKYQLQPQPRMSSRSPSPERVPSPSHYVMLCPFHDNSILTSHTPHSYTNLHNDDWVKLNVGGEVMTTTRTTLTKDKSSVLYKMFSLPSQEDLLSSSGQYWNPDLCPRDESGAFFLDCDPKFVFFVFQSNSS